MKIIYACFFVLLLASCAVKKTTLQIRQDQVDRVIRTLSSDDMQGRGLFSPGIENAASFIETEFRNIGLQPLSGTTSFRQNFSSNQISPADYNVSINNKTVAKDNAFFISDQSLIAWNTPQDATIQYIRANESFVDRYRAIISQNQPALVYVAPAHAEIFKRYREHYMEDRVVENFKSAALAFILGGEEQVQNFTVTFKNTIDKAPLANIVGVLPGRSKAKEIVIFSGHYDHLGFISPVEGDSVANGADDDASGVTAVIELARYYKKLANNERTLIFVAFTAEEVGGVGSQYFSKQQTPDDVVAMFNIEMIGKESKFGKNAAFITGYEKSDFGKILQKNLEETEFKFYPDPYPAQNLFYRSDNATLAAQGVPAHTISTDQIDKDPYYHTAKDEYSTLNVSNITSTIKAIALSSRSIVEGKDTPSRIAPLR